jgi:hypothetical protein
VDIESRVTVLEVRRSSDADLLRELRDDMRGLKDEALPSLRVELESHRRESGEHWARVRGALWVVGVVWVLLSALIPFLIRVSTTR